MEVRMGARQLGVTVERLLVNQLHEWGFDAYRDPKSKVDVLAFKKGKVLVFEVKFLSTPRNVAVLKTQLQRALEVAEKLGGEAVLTVYIDIWKEWRALPMKLIAKFPLSSWVYKGQKMQVVIVPESCIVGAHTLEQYLRGGGVL
jgi:Holliday junction resolvase